MRALWRRADLTAISAPHKKIPSGSILLFCTLRNERIRLPYFLDYYRSLGITKFFFVDNDSSDGTREYLTQQDDVFLWTVTKSYTKSRFGMDWITGLLRRYGHNHWCLTVDVDEFFVYPFCETRPLRALTDWLDTTGVRAFSAMLLDMYPKGNWRNAIYHEGQNPFELSEWFDGGNYIFTKNFTYGNLWIQGGVRARSYFKDAPRDSPALNKIPLVKWDRRFSYVSSTHMLLPRGLNLVYDSGRGEKASGCLLHFKFLNIFSEKIIEELERKQHYHRGNEYLHYRNDGGNDDMWNIWSERYINWRQLEILGLMSKGNWA